jgi:aspartate/methionine/tyrosine aminotransferase
MSPRIAARVEDFRRTLSREIFESAPKDSFNLGLGQPDFDPPAVFCEALAVAASMPDSGYGPTAGDRVLRERVAQSYHGFVRGPEDVLITLGCQNATFTALGCLLDPGDELLVPDPGFPGAERAAKSWGATPVFYPLRAENSFRIDVDDLMSRVGPLTRGVLLITPSNPTGAVEPQATIDRLIEETARRGIALIIDEIYKELCYVTEEPAPGVPAVQQPHMIVCGGLSKSVALTGWRVGWAVCSDPVFMDKMTALHQTVLTCPSTPIQRACRVAFEPAGKQAAREIRSAFKRRRDLVASILGSPSKRCAPLDGAFYAWVDASAAGGGRKFAKALLDEEKIVVIPGEGFGQSAPDWFRISYCQPEERLGPALRVIAERLNVAVR